MEGFDENPYVTVVAKKHRNLRKKLDKILKIETQRNEGKKALNEEQLVLLTTKGSVEKALADVDSIKTQLEDVARQELQLKQLQKEQEAAVAETTEASTGTPSVEVNTLSTQCEQEGHDVACGVDEAMKADQQEEPQPSFDPATYREMLRSQVFKLLKLFHVCARYPTLMGNSLPPDIVYFGKCLMGETSISGFRDTLQQSTRNAELYLDEEMASKYEAIRGMSYSQIADIIDSLAGELESPAPVHPPTPPPRSPQINFFADAPEPKPAAESEPSVAGEAQGQESLYVGEGYGAGGMGGLPPAVLDWAAPSSGSSLLGGEEVVKPVHQDETEPKSVPAASGEAEQQGEGVRSTLDPVHVPGEGGKKGGAPGKRGGRNRPRGNRGGRGAAAAQPAESKAQTAAPAQAPPPQAEESKATVPSKPRGKAWGSDSRREGALAAVAPSAPASASEKPSSTPSGGKPKGEKSNSRAPASGNNVKSKRPPRNQQQGAANPANSRAGNNRQPRDNRPKQQKAPAKPQQQAA